MNESISKFISPWLDAFEKIITDYSPVAYHSVEFKILLGLAVVGVFFFAKFIGTLIGSRANMLHLFAACLAPIILGMLLMAAGEIYLLDKPFYYDLPKEIREYSHEILMGLGIFLGTILARVLSLMGYIRTVIMVVIVYGIVGSGVYFTHRAFESYKDGKENYKKTKSPLQKVMDDA